MFDDAIDVTQNDTTLEYTQNCADNTNQELTTETVDYNPYREQSNETVDYNLTDSELVVNKQGTKIYQHDSAYKDLCPTEKPATTPIKSTEDIDMLEDATNAELVNFSDNLAESLVITDLKDLMDYHDTYQFRGIRHKQDKTLTSDGKKYKCLACPTSWETTGAMCRHYKERHPAVLCTDCGKLFSSPLTLARHSYKHK